MRQHSSLAVGVPVATAATATWPVVVRQWLLALGGYVIILSYVFRPIFTTSGMPVGGDWSQPVTSTQMNVFGNLGLYVWSDQWNIIGVKQSYMTDTPFRLLIKMLGDMGVSGNQAAKGLLVFTFLFAAISLWSYCRYLGLRAWPSFLGGFFLITSPLFFDYTTIGWLQVLWSVALFPWSVRAFREAIRWDQPAQAILAALCCVLATQSQSLVWFPLLWLICAAVGVYFGAQLRVALKMLMLGSCLVVLANVSWLPLLVGGSSIVGVPASTSAAIEGLQLTSVNFARSWGSLFNMPYEVAAGPTIGLLSIGFLFVVFAVLLLVRPQWTTVFHVVIAALPFFFWSLYTVYSRLPYTGVIRDPARFMVLEAFAYAVLLAVLLDSLLGSLQKTEFVYQRLVIIVLSLGMAIGAIVSASPLLSGSLFGPSRSLADIRLRTLQFDPSYFRTEQWLVQQETQDKALYLPIGGIVQARSNPRFQGLFQEFIDDFASYSPVPGEIDRAYRSVPTAPQDITDLLAERVLGGDGQMARLLGLMDVRYIIARHDLYAQSGRVVEDQLLKALENDPNFQAVRRDGPITVLQNRDVLPRVREATAWSILTGDMTTLAMAVGGTSTPMSGSVFFLEHQLTGEQRVQLEQHHPGTAQNAPTISFTEINPTQYVVHANGATGPFFLILSEAFDPNWRLYVDELGSDHNLQLLAVPTSMVAGSGRAAFRPAAVKYLTRSSLPVADHFIADGFANAWYIDPGSGGTTSMEVTLLFQPQLYFYGGLGTALLVWLAATIFAAWSLATCRPYQHGGDYAPRKTGTAMCSPVGSEDV